MFYPILQTDKLKSETEGNFSQSLGKRTESLGKFTQTFE
jgi:hypothetical protein